MKFPSLTTTIISAAVMAGVAIASEDLNITPLGLPCRGTVGCSTLNGFNHGNGFGFYCSNHRIWKYTPCQIGQRCHVTSPTTVACS
ncbi:hypothetical protein DEU56DRAFT_800385 [Suillus clintonianus]|uniref:uncharacterized protein n=1 Tax=Suillus clintonianus TaxID=1904413 RepID=UPI001B8616D8|nr:uncharacterized protein DEU56DRAFT_800385 [Suillus clintonianus]KAG2139247.1 hypothetical protein DEU56DRAFT_800385 [Suillus clintonianus]